MTRSTMPRTLFGLMEWEIGRRLTEQERNALWPTLEPVPFVGILVRVRKTAGTDRPLTPREASGLREARSRQASAGLARPRRLEVAATTREAVPFLGIWPFTHRPFEERTVGHYRRGARRFERWAMRAERLGLDKSRPPAHIRDMATSLVNLQAIEGAQ